MDGCKAAASGGMPGDNACAGLRPEDREALAKAAGILLDARGVIIMVTEAIGRAMGNIGGTASDFLKDKVGIDVAA
jgi:hypothetical protein